MRDKEYLEWLRDQKCCITLQHPPSDPAHNFKSINGGGIGLKSMDKRALPLSHDEHMKQHRIGELSYWRDVVMKDDVILKQMVGAWAEVYFYNRYLQEKK